MVTVRNGPVPELMTVREAAAALGIDRRTILRMIGKGRLLRCGCSHCGPYGPLLKSSVEEALRKETG